jgi:hypothetical protein
MELQYALTEVAMKLNIIKSYDEILNTITELNNKIGEIDDLKLSVCQLNNKINNMNNINNMNVINNMNNINDMNDIKKGKKRLEPIKL